jgi:hypothetical protein
MNVMHDARKRKTYEFEVDPMSAAKNSASAAISVFAAATVTAGKSAKLSNCIFHTAPNAAYERTRRCRLRIGKSHRRESQIRYVANQCDRRKAFRDIGIRHVRPIPIHDPQTAALLLATNKALS